MAETAFRLLGLLDRPDELVVLLHATKFELYYRFLQSEHGAQKPKRRLGHFA